MATPEATPVINDPDAPFDYRKEKTNETIAQFQAEYGSAEHAFVTGGENYVLAGRFLNICAAVKQLGIAVPPLSNAAEKKILIMLNHALKSVAIAADEIRLLNNTYLYDPSLFTKLGWLARRNMQKFFAYLDAMNTNSGLNAEELAFLFLARRSEIAVIPNTLVEDVTHKRLTDLGLGERSPYKNRYFLEDRANARIIGIANVPPLRSEDWDIVRDTISSANSTEKKEATQHQALTLLYARIINAKAISIDEDGLHIVDHDTEKSKTRSDTPVPTRKHI